MTRALPVGLTLAAVLVLAVPARAQNRREMQMMADIRMLQEQNQLLQVTLAQLGDALKALNSRLDDSANVTSKAFADQRLRVDELATGLRQVRERVDDSNVRISNMSQEIEALRLAIPQYPPPVPPAAIDPGAMPGTAPGAPGTAPGQTPVPPVSPAPAPPAGAGMSPQRLFDTAWADYTAGQWDLCILGMESYLRNFPRSELADDAQLYIGECNFANGRFTEAAAAYTQLIVSYPKGDQVPMAYYKRGLALERLGQLDRARESYEQVMKLHPESDPARVAKQALDRINRNRPPA
jgi:tol-pal system protein YbgF